MRRVDNLLRPDLVAPGNKIVAAAAADGSGGSPVWNALATSDYDKLVASLGITQSYPEQQMMMSGTSIAAPAVAGAAAVLLQANPGLTPPLVKAILQYTAQPLPGYNLLQQGAGNLNIDGAVALAKVIKTDITSKVAIDGYSVGQTINAKNLPMPSSTINGESFNWSRIVFAGGNSVLSGSTLFMNFQAIWDPRITWAGGTARKRAPVYWSGNNITANTYVQNFTEAALGNQVMISSGVVNANGLAGTSSWVAGTGAFTPTATLSGWLVSGAGLVMSEGIVMSEALSLSGSVSLSGGLSFTKADSAAVVGE